MKILLIRHADCLQEGFDPEISQLGTIQAKLLAKRLSKIPISMVYVSDLKRTVQTFEEYHQIVKKISFEKTKDIREIYRVLVGGAPKEGTSKNREKEDKERIEKFFKKLISKDHGQIVAIFTHGNVIKYMLSKFLDSDPLRLGPRVSILSAGITLVDFNNGKVDVKFVNNIEHLTDLDSSNNYMVTGKKETYAS